MLYLFSQSIAPVGDWNITQSMITPSEAVGKIASAWDAGTLTPMVFYGTTAKALTQMMMHHGHNLRFSSLRKGDRITVDITSGDCVLMARLREGIVSQLGKHDVPCWESDILYTWQEFAQVTGEVGRPPGKSAKRIERETAAREMRQAGKSNAEIADALGVHTASVPRYFQD